MTFASTRPVKSQLSNAFRSYAAEFGIVGPAGRQNVTALIKRVLKDDNLPEMAQDLFRLQAEEPAPSVSVKSTGGCRTAPTRTLASGPSSTSGFAGRCRSGRIRRRDPRCSGFDRRHLPGVPARGRLSRLVRHAELAASRGTKANEFDPRQRGVDPTLPFSSIGLGGELHGRKRLALGIVLDVHGLKYNRGS